MDVQQEFWRRLKEEWLPAYCNDAQRCYGIEGFTFGKKTVADCDARDFLRAIDHDVVTVDSGGRFRMPRSDTHEVLFLEGLRSVRPRPVTIWIEPIITIAAIARLHLDYGWPKELLGMQSEDWAFDIVAFKPPNLTTEHIAGEVKPTKRDLDRFLTVLNASCAAGDHECAKAPPLQRNADKKWLGLKRCRAPVFWAVGPGGDSRVFDVSYHDGRIELAAAGADRLKYSPDPKGLGKRPDKAQA